MTTAPAIAAENRNSRVAIPVFPRTGIQYPIKIRKAAIPPDARNIFRVLLLIACQFRLFNRLLRTASNRKRFRREEKDVASARPRCFRFCIRMSPRMTLAMSAAMAILTGVFASFRA
jgi:hypothetical protein